MNLRHDDEPLSPEEARAFLQVHAEREARGTQGTRVADLAESLNLSPDETRSILAEAKARAGKRPSFVLLACGLALIAGLLLVAQMLLALNRSPGAVAAAPSTTVPLMGVASATPSPALKTGTVPVEVPEGFEIAIRVPGAETTASGPPAKSGTDVRTLDAGETMRVRDQLVEATLAMMENALRDSEAWMRAQELSVYLRVAGGGWTLVRVPLKPFTLPLQGNPGGRASLRATLGALYEAGWSDVVRASPR